VPRRPKTRQTALRFSAGSRAKGRPSEALRQAARWGLWLLIGLAVLAALWGSYHGLRQVLLAQNGHFVLREIEVNIYGRLTRDEVLAELAENGVEAGTTNLFSVCPGALRRDLEDWHVLISKVNVARRLPGTLQIDIYERRPVAQLVRRKGYLLDGRGLVLPARNDPKTWFLPIITGVRGAGDLSVGSRVEDELVSASLKLLELVNTGTYGDYLAVNLVKIEPARRVLWVFLGKRQPFCEGACVVLPGQESELEGALERLRVVIQQRIQANQTTGFIDATYRVNIPARATPPVPTPSRERSS